MNEAVISGRVIQAPAILRMSNGAEYARMVLSVRRLSGAYDHVPVMTYPGLADGITCGMLVQVYGHVHVFSPVEGARRRWRMAIKALMIERHTEENHGKDANEVKVSGRVHSAPVFRKTPIGRLITDLVIDLGHSPNMELAHCIVWGNLAIKATSYREGDVVSILGRFQSREYVKRYDDGSEEEKVAYEISCCDTWVDSMGNEAVKECL